MAEDKFWLDSGNVLWHTRVVNGVTMARWRNEETGRMTRWMEMKPGEWWSPLVRTLDDIFDG